MEFNWEDLRINQTKRLVQVTREGNEGNQGNQGNQETTLMALICSEEMQQNKRTSAIGIR